MAQTANEHGVSRRSITKGMAWAAPAVTVGVVAPRAAASPPPVRPDLGQDSCKHSSEKRYHIDLNFTNTNKCATTVTITQLVVNPFSGQDVPLLGYPTTFTINPESTLDIPAIDSEVVGNIANGTLDVSYTYTNCKGEVVAETVSVEISSLPPCKISYPH